MDFGGPSQIINQAGIAKAFTGWPISWAPRINLVRIVKQKSNISLQMVHWSLLSDHLKGTFKTVYNTTDFFEIHFFFKFMCMGFSVYMPEHRVCLWKLWVDSGSLRTGVIYAWECQGGTVESSLGLLDGQSVHNHRAISPAQYHRLLQTRAISDHQINKLLYKIGVEGRKERCRSDRDLRAFFFAIVKYMLYQYRNQEYLSVPFHC